LSYGGNDKQNYSIIFLLERKGLMAYFS